MHKLHVKASQARQVADRFHLVQNLRLAIERQLSRAPRLLKPEGKQHWTVSKPQPTSQQESQDPDADRRRLVWQARFAEVKRPQQAGKTLAAIAIATGLNWRTVSKWATCETLPERRRMDPRARHPVQFTTHLARRWTEGCRNGRELLLELREQGYPGSRAQLKRLLWEWRRNDALPRAQLQTEGTQQALGSVTAVPPITASILCTTPRARLRQASRVDVLKERLPGFADMRQLAMRFGGLLRGRDPAMLDAWLADVRLSSFSALRRFACPVQGYRRRAKRHSRRMEQRADGGTNQQAESAQAFHVWSSWSRASP